MGKHAKLAPSAAKRWINCPGSIALCSKVEKKTSTYAAEGTAAHELAEQCISIGAEPEDFIDQKINDFVVTEEMAEAVSVYTSYVTELLQDSMLYEVEKKFNLNWIDEDIFGTNDCFILKGNELHVIDYKHGKGTIVEPQNNPQLMIYALGAIHDVWERGDKIINALSIIENVHLTIVQPRADHAEGQIRTWKTTAKQLIFWGLHVLREAANTTRKPNANLAVGDHCKFCDAISICPEQEKYAIEIAKSDFQSLPDPTSMSGKEIARVMEASDVFKKWAEEAVGYALVQMQNGVEIPGYKLVKRKSNRKWIDDASAENLLNSLIGEEAYNMKLISPTQAEKKLKKLGHSPEMIADQWEKPDTGLTLAKDTDRRKEVITGAIADFSDTLDEIL